LYFWQFIYIENVLKIYKKRLMLEEKLKNYISGSLVKITRKSGRKELYWKFYEKGKINKKYLSPKIHREIIERLEQKRKECPAIKKELAELKKLCKQLLPMAEKILGRIKIIPASYPPTPSENNSHPEWLRFRTNRGEMVRSMSEKIIADTLYKYGIYYAYEKSLVVDGITYHPDFTILNPISGTVFYWEHCGLNTDEYISRWHKKLGAFTENGIYLDENLIVTTQDDMNDIESVVKERFTLERYRGMMG